MTTNSSNYILESSREYSLYVCENRAIPKAADGLKDAQRKAAWIIRNKGDKIKTVSLGGEMISSNLYLHGDASAAGTISLMAGEYVNNIPFFQGIGTFGTRTNPTGYSAPRYTYVKRSSVTQNLLYPDLDIVPLKENYDGSTVEPVHFLPLIPTVLLNGVSGIAVGWSTEILRRSFTDLVDATLNVLKGKKLTRIKPYYEKYNIDVKHLEDNSWEFTGKVVKVDSSTAKVIELPPDLSLTKFKERLNGLEDDGKINTYTDSSTKVIDITIKFARGSIADWTEDKLIDFLKLRQKKTERIVVIDFNNQSIRQYETAEQLIVAFTEWRLGWYKTRYEKLINEAKYDLAFWQGIKDCFEAKLPESLQKVKNKSELLELIQGITTGLDKNQTDRIASLPSYRWAADAYSDVKEKIKELKNSIKEYEGYLKDPNELKRIYSEELEALKKLRF